MGGKKIMRMVLPQSQLSAFFSLLQQGVWVRVLCGCSVMALLTEQFGIEKAYVLDRVTTLFLDGKAIDDPETSYVKDGSTIALSSAMPGLVGATMRRGGHLAAMRGEITHKNQAEVEAGAGLVRVKLFNMVMAELGPSILAHGICLSSTELVAFLEERSRNFWESFGAVIISGRQVDPAKLIDHIRLAQAVDDIRLKVEFKPEY